MNCIMYGLSESEARVLRGIVERAQRMDEAGRARLLEAAKAIRLVRELGELSLEDENGGQGARPADEKGA